MSPKMPLEGIRVLDFGWRAVAPISARMLAWGGAEVIRIESTTRHDGARQMDPVPPGGEDSFNMSGWFNNYNSNKLSISLNLRDPRGKELALRMVPDADIVVENFSAGTMNRMGLGYEALAAIKPDIIMASHSLAGLTGPWKHVKGHGPMGAAMAGLHYLAGYEDSDPIAPGQAFTDYTVNPYVSSYALMAALHHRRRTGKGQYIDLSQYESIVSTAGTTVLEYTALGRVRPRTGNRSPNAAPQGVYPCKPIHIDGQMEERWCAISISTDEEWQALCGVIGRPELAEHPSYATFQARKDHEDETDPIISEWTSDSLAEDVMQRLQQAGVSAGVVQNGKELVEDPQLAARGHYRKVVHAEAGERIYEGPPFIMSECPVEIKPAPLLGEHNDYVFRNILNLTEEEINEGFVEGYIA
jgi:benzylsuccinate CoA-transferase BbsF subunit